MSHLETLLQTALGTDYRLEQEISGGGMSRLYFATDLRLNRRVVVKVLSPELVSDTSIARFKREIEVTVQLQHPHILPILTSGSCEDMLFYITPFIAGESLKDRIVRNGKLPLDDVIEILRNVSGALAFAHSRGVVHRDIKPANILLAERHAVLADFGIAKATERSSAALTATGVMPGTPAYMAPELPTDEKADVYALGVVAYEMLCATLPKRGVTAKQIILARGAVPGDDRDRLRSIATLVANSLSLSADTRTESAQAFAHDLDRRPRTYGGLALVGAAVAVVAIGAAFILNPGRRGLDGNRYAVMALSQPADAPLAADVAQRVSDAFGEWRGPSAVDQRMVAGAVGARGTQALEPKAMAVVGRALGAGNVLALDTRREGDSVVVRATLLDVARDSLLRSRRMAYASTDGPPAQAMAIRRLVNSILRDGAELPWRSATDRDTASLSAWRAYDDGRRAIQRWDLATATQAFRTAVAAAPKLASAHLWLAQTLLWSQSSANGVDPRAAAPLEARNSARRALDLSRRLDPRDSARAAGVLLLADARYADACSAFARLVALDSTDVGGWIGLGDCQAQDHSVLPSPGTRTGWRFRTSFEAAARAYQRAVDMGPAEDESPFQGWVLGRLSGVLYTVPNHLRIGQAANPDSITLAAFPFLDHDTVAFEPFLVRDLNTGKYDPPQAAVQAAVQRNRTLLRRSAEEWVRRAPRNGAAYDSLAGWMEVSGGVGMLGEKQVGTLEVLRRARALTTDSIAQLRLAIADVRLLVKDSRFAEARAEADSVLRAPIATTHAGVVGVAGLATLLGYAARTAQLLPAAAETPISMPDGMRLVPPQEVRQTAGQLLAYAALDIPGDSIPTIARRVLAVVGSHFRDSATAARVSTVLVGLPLTLSYPAGAPLLRQVEPPTDLTSRGYGALARGDTAAARTALAEARGVSARSTGGTVDASLRRARLALLLRDTTTALRELDPVLRALSTIAPSLLTEVPQAAALVRGLALRAEIADRMLDRATAKLCANAVVDLWLNADAPLQPIVARMKTLAGRS